MRSLRSRLILAASLVLAIFLGVTGYALDRVFQDAALAQVRDSLQSRIYALLGAAEISGGTLTLPRSLPDPDYAVPGSGLYARIDRGDGQSQWRSRSMVDLEIDFPRVPEPGRAVFAQSRTRGNAGAQPPAEGLFTLSYRVRWEVDQARARDYLVHVAQSRTSFDQRRNAFRHNLWFWLAGASLMLLAVQGLILAWSLTPLRQLIREVAAIEHGEREFLSDQQLQELRPLVRSLNQLIRIGRRQLQRHRDALADLAHSLKTPLTMLKTTAEQATSLEELHECVETTISRLDDNLSYQLHRAAAGAGDVLTAPQALLPLVQRLSASLRKVHADRPVEISAVIDADLTFRADSNDLMEILGNLLDNACKWARRRIIVRAQPLDPGHGAGLKIEVDDDGPGIPVNDRRRILQRGARLDERTPGHGLGLAIVHQLVVEHYGGELQVDESPAGGARVTVILREN